MAPVQDMGPNNGGTGATGGFLTETNYRIPCNLIRTDPITNDYEMESRPFARGKFAQVRRCTHKKSGLEYAAKVVRKRRRLTDVRHEILHEIRVLLMAGQTDKIVSLHEVFETPSEFILMLEMVEGGELQKVLDEEEALPEKYCVSLVRQVLEAVSFLHNNNIAHLDIKPQNILLVNKYPSEGIKLCDFGISRLIESGSELREIVGTPDYVAPEILHYDPISLATDMWSIGILTYALLTGYSPFGGDTKQETFFNITNGKADFSDDVFDGISQNAIDFISRLLVKTPSQRMTYQECLNHDWLQKDLIPSPEVPMIITTTAQEEEETDSDKENQENINNNLKNDNERVNDEVKGRLNLLSNQDEKTEKLVPVKIRSCSINNGKTVAECPRRECLLPIDRYCRSRSLSLERKAVKKESPTTVSLKSSSKTSSSSTSKVTTSSTKLSHLKTSSIDFESIKRTLIFCDKDRVAVVY